MQQYQPEDYKGEFNLLVMEKLTIKHYIKDTDHNTNQISKILGITPSTLKTRIKKHNLE